MLKSALKLLLPVTISLPESSFPLTSGRKTRALGATISGVRHRCRLCSETGRAKFGYLKMVAPRALVFRPLVKGHEDSGNEIAPVIAALSNFGVVWTQISNILSVS